MAKTLTLRVDDPTYESFVRWAKAENRSLSNFIETTVKERIRESSFVDNVEMAEILADERLVARLRRGSKDAKNRKGTFVD